MSDLPDARRPWFDRIKLIYWVIGVVVFLAGVGSTAFIKFTVYYLAEQTSIDALSSLKTTGSLTLDQITGINSQLQKANTALLLQGQTNDNAAASLRALEQHAHELDARADTDRDALAAIRADIATQTQQIKFLLDPLVRRK